MRALRPIAAALAALPLRPAAAFAQFTSWEGAGETVQTGWAAFLRAHPRLVFGGLPVVMLVVYILIMGPVDVLDAAQRVLRGRRRGVFGNYGGFGSDGGFGGDPRNGDRWR